MNQKGFALIAVVLIVLGMLVLATGGLFISTTTRVGEKGPERQEWNEPEQVIDETADWEIYQNEKHGFSFAHPRNFQLMEYDFTRGSLLASTYIEEPIPFSLVLLQDIYIDSAQTPLINLDVVKTSLTIEQLLGHVRKIINKQAEILKNPEAPYYGAPPPEIKSVETITIGDLKMTKVVHDIGPGGPNPILSEYYVAYPGYIFVFFSNYGSPCSSEYCGETEKEILPIILSTFKFIELEEVDKETSGIEALKLPMPEEVEEEEEAVAPNTPIMKNIDTYSTPDIPSTIDWVSISGAEIFVLERADDSLFSSPVVAYHGSLSSFTETLSPSKTTRYFFRVKACNGSECSPWSSITLLVIEVVADPDASTEPTPSLPLDTPTLSDPGDSIEPLVDPAGPFEASYNLSWQVIEGAAGYVLQANPSYSFDAEWDPTWGFHEHNITGDNIGIQIQRVLSPTVFYYRVKAVNDYGESSWSNIVDIEVLPSQPSITISSPNGGEMWKRGEKIHISWSSNQVDTAQIKIRNADTGNILQIDRLSSNPHYYDWTIPLDFILGDRHEIQVLDLNNSQICDWSDKYFRIVSQSAISQSITLTSPNGGEIWRAGETHQITWDSVGVDFVKIYIFDPSILGSGSTRYITPINISVLGTSESCSWIVPSLGQLPGGGGDNYKINIVDASNSQTKDTSDDFFSIINP